MSIGTNLPKNKFDIIIHIYFVLIKTSKNLYNNTYTIESSNPIHILFLFTINLFNVLLT